MKLEDAILIKAAPEKVWPYLTEPAKIKAWYFPLEEFAFTGEQTVGLGATFTYVEKAPIGRVRLDFEITEWLEERKVAFTMTSGQFLKSNKQSWAIEPEADGCRFRFSEEAQMPYGIAGRALELVASRTSSANIRKMLVLLKDLAESS